MKSIIIWLIRAYQRYLSKWLPSSCRYHPSCSEYAAQALSRYGIGKGSYLALRRVLRCHPFSPGGYDPIR
jgi:putative membrane protein insertion efficiency factor